MRKLVLIAAIAATIMPAAANAQWNSGDHNQRTDVRQNRHDDRGDRNDRNDRRDTRQNRNHHSRVAYVAPYSGWTYRTVTPGYQLRPEFFGSRYTISDYGAYQLQAPRRFQRWIRYGDDLVLVNVRTGRVLQVLHNRYY
jgi:Ni/Co efflux regulator RcnB